MPELPEVQALVDFLGERTAGLAARRSVEVSEAVLVLGREVGKPDPKNANDHEQGARVHPAQPLFRGRPGAGTTYKLNVAVTS